MTNYQDEWMAAVLGPLVPEDKLTKLKDDAELRGFFDEIVSRGKRRLAAKRKAARG